MDGYPWRAVTKAEERRSYKKAGRLRVDDGTVWWVLHLECGHRVTRDGKRGPRARGSYGKREREWLPAPKRARCNSCPRSTE